jgi:hypothetical protein
MCSRQCQPRADDGLPFFGFDSGGDKGHDVRRRSTEGVAVRTYNMNPIEAVELV